jgi:hypothetical protein
MLDDLRRWNIWYIEGDQNPSHEIWREWREGHTNRIASDGKTFTPELEYFYWNITEPSSAMQIAKCLDVFDGEDADLKNFIIWVRYWAEKSAYFILSVS